MARILKTNTAVRIVVGPLVDLTDGTTLETGLTVTGLTLNLISESDAGGAPTKSIDAVSPTASGGNNDMVAIQGGYYDLEITAGQVNFVGRAKFGIYDVDAIAPYFEDWIVLAANVYDALMGTDKLQVHADEITAGLITAAAIATNAIDADALAADAVTEIQSGLATAAALTTIDDFLDTEIAAILADTNELQTDLANGGRLDLLIDAIKAKTDNLPADPADDSDIDAQLAAISGYLDTEIAAILAAVDTEVAAIKAKTDNLPASPANEASLVTIAGYIDTEVASILAAVDTEVSAIKAKTDNLPAAPAATGDIPTASAIADQVWDEAISGHLGAGSTGAALNAAGSSGDPWSTPLPGAYGAGTAGKIIGDNVNAPIATVDTVVDAIKAVSDKIDTTLEVDGAVYRFTDNALEEAPAGGSGGTLVLPVMQGRVYEATALQSREVRIKRGDTPTITFNLGADYTGWTPWFASKITIRDTEYAIEPKEATWIDASTGQGSVTLTAAENATTGLFNAEIELRSGDSRLTAMSFKLVVLADVIQDD